jgi:hypothetical protein
MTAPDTLPAANRRRAARLLLACLDENGSAEVTAVLDEADRAPGGLAGLISALTFGALELLVTSVGENNARRTLELALLDAEVDSND